MTPRQKLRLRACRMLISYQKNGDFEFQSPRVERIFSGETGNLITQFIQHERAIGRSEKTIESREIYLRAFNLYLQRFDLSFNDLSVDCIEAFFKSMNYEFEKYNVMLERWLRANYRSGYWELVFLHTKPLAVVPPDMRAGRRYAPLPCSLCVLALEHGPCGLGISSPRPESSGCGWVLWSLGFGAYAASGGRAMPSSSQVVSAK